MIVPNAVDVESFGSTGFQPVPVRASDTAGHALKTPATVRVGFLGRLDPIKRIGDLIEAMTMLDERFELQVYGEGSDRSRIEVVVVRLDLSDRVKSARATANPQAAIASMDILVLPSKAEGFGLVLIEAMAARVPVVATDVPGIRDVVKHEQTGLLVPVASPDELARAIRRIAEDDALRKRLTEAAYEDVQRRFSWPAVLRQYRGVLGLESP